MVVLLIIQLVTVQLTVGISHFYSGAVPMSVHGVNGLVKVQLQMGIY